MVTTSHNPAKYNGYKAYGPDGCQMTDDAVCGCMILFQKTDASDWCPEVTFSEGVEKGRSSLLLVQNGLCKGGEQDKCVQVCRVLD